MFAQQYCLFGYYVVLAVVAINQNERRKVNKEGSFTKLLKV